ncbi:MAG: 2-C-methyl-D-erythritol 2,4-cyclodiphosphate synthase [Chloroflexi bacterium]|nr:2-C-methyl-D-erythritol 2,4-cyclodiphosphate synthase [Chloroflexota bacterium]
MIRSIMNKTGGRDQRGGIAILTALGFLLFSVPLITSSLNLAQNTAIDARVKTNIVHRQYCGLAVQEYLDYLLLDNTRWADWLTANVDPNDPTGATYTETVNPCGRNLTITVTQQTILPPGSFEDSGDGGSGDGEYTIPPLPSYNNRNFQVTKTVSDPNPTGGGPVTYTITVVNRDETGTTLTKIEDTLPPGFSYDCNAPEDQLTLPGEDPQDIEPTGASCPGGNDIEWSLPPNTSLQQSEAATLTFTVITSVTPGTYCNEAQVSPGGDNTRSGKTAIVQIGPSAGPCPGEAVAVSKTVTSASLVSTDTNTFPYTYSFDIDYTDPAYAGADSAELLRSALQKVRTAGHVPLNVDIVVHAERPKLSAYKLPMRAAIAGLLGRPAFHRSRKCPRCRLRRLSATRTSTVVPRFQCACAKRSARRFSGRRSQKKNPARVCTRL